MNDNSDDDEDHDQFDDDEIEGYPKLFNENPDLKYIPDDERRTTVFAKKQMQFERISREAQENCVKAIYRLMVFKGSRKEVVTSKHIADELATLDAAYRKFTSVVAYEVRKLFATGITGYRMISGDEIVAPEGSRGKKDEFFIVNGLSSAKLQQALAAPAHHSADYSFMLMVFFAILTAPGQRITFDQLLQQMHHTDSRFPQTIQHQQRAQASADAERRANLALPELSDDFVGLLNRMKKEGYVDVTKDAQDARDLGKQVYTFGTRFYLEIGKVRLAESYYMLANLPNDETVLKEMSEERDRWLDELREGEGDEEDDASVE